MHRGTSLLLAITACAIAGTTFDVASIKPSDPADRRMRVDFDAMGAGRLSAHSISLSWLVQFAYDLQTYQMSGGPGWIDTSRFDVMAQSDDKAGGRDHVREMTRALLAERFALKVHTESKELPIYKLTTVRQAKGLRAVAACAAPECPVFDMARGGDVTAHGVTMEDIAHMLTDVTGRPVRNQTALAGQYDFHLLWTPDDATPGALGPRGSAGPDQTQASIFTALTEQLGLKLLSDKGPVDIYAIDRAEKPSQN